MVILPFYLKNQTLCKGVGFPELVEKSNKWLKIRVEDLPDGYSASAYLTMSWRPNENPHGVVMMNGECEIPEYITTLPEIVNDYIEYTIGISVSGINDDGSRFTTNTVDVVVSKTNYQSETENTPEIPQSQYEQFVQNVNEAAVSVEENKETVEAAASAAGISESKAYEHAENALASEQRAAQYAAEAEGFSSSAGAAAGAAARSAQQAAEIVSEWVLKEDITLAEAVKTVTSKYYNTESNGLIKNGLRFVITIPADSTAITSPVQYTAIYNGDSWAGYYNFNSALKQNTETRIVFETIKENGYWNTYAWGSAGIGTSAPSKSNNIQYGFMKTNTPESGFIKTTVADAVFPVGTNIKIYIR